MLHFPQVPMSMIVVVANQWWINSAPSPFLTLGTHLGSPPSCRLCRCCTCPPRKAPGSQPELMLFGPLNLGYILIKGTKTLFPLLDHNMQTTARPPRASEMCVNATWDGSMLAVWSSSHFFFLSFPLLPPFSPLPAPCDL